MVHPNKKEPRLSLIQREGSSSLMIVRPKRMHNTTQLPQADGYVHRVGCEQHKCDAAGDKSGSAFSAKKISQNLPVPHLARAQYKDVVAINCCKPCCVGLAQPHSKRGEVNHCVRH